jgi:methylmalonyl-CoA/ethylmalonyl-CoA epimerase
VIDTATILPAGSSFHHIGVACRDLVREQEGLADLGYQPSGAQFTDPRQGVVGLFLEGPGPRLELLAPSGDSQVLDPWLSGRAKMYHLAYEVPQLDEALHAAAAAGAPRVSEPVPALAFDDRAICFVVLRNLFLVELIEAVAPA